MFWNCVTKLEIIKPVTREYQRLAINTPNTLRNKKRISNSRISTPRQRHCKRLEHNFFICRVSSTGKTAVYDFYWIKLTPLYETFVYCRGVKSKIIKRVCVCVDIKKLLCEGVLFFALTLYLWEIFFNKNTNIYFYDYTFCNAV